MMKKLRALYAHPDDVDLIIGGMAERPVDDGLLGPTFRCLIFEQFSRTRRTDRYFYDSAYQPHPFTPGKRCILIGKEMIFISGNINIIVLRLV